MPCGKAGNNHGAQIRHCRKRWHSGLGEQSSMIWQFFAMAIDLQDNQRLCNANSHNPPLPVISYEAIGPDGIEYEDIMPHELPAFLQNMGII
jgi:hypothetical protein